jgi:putative spermidine/putrescine transport system ATP-binding protein
MPENSFPVAVSDNIYQGDHLRVQLKGAAQNFIARRDRRAREWAPGTAVHAVFPAEDCWVIAP